MRIFPLFSKYWDALSHGFWTHSHRLDSFDELFALQVLQNLVDLSQRKVALEADVSAPDSCSEIIHMKGKKKSLRGSDPIIGISTNSLV